MVAVGLKIPGSTREMQSAANDANIERMEQGSKQALIIAQKLEARLTNLIQSFKDQDVGFVLIEKNYEIIW